MRGKAMALDTKILYHRFSVKISLTNVILVLNADGFACPLIVMGESFV